MRYLRFSFWHEFLFGPIPAVRLAVFEKVFASTFLIYMVAWLHNGCYEWLTDYGFHYTVDIVGRGYPNPWPTLPTSMVPAFVFVLLGSTICFIVGYKRNLMIWVVLLCAQYVQLVDQPSAYTLNKLYIVGFFLCALAPNPQKLEGCDELMQSAWPIRILQATLMVHYFCAGACKVIHGGWLDHADILWTHVQGIYRTDIAAWQLQVLPIWVWTILGLSALTFELFAPILFGFRSMRPVAYVWGVGFHLGIAINMEKLIYFSLQMVVFYIVFMNARHLLALQNRLRMDKKRDET